MYDAVLRHRLLCDLTLVDIAQLEKAGERGPPGAARDHSRHGGSGIGSHRAATETAKTAALQQQQLASSASLAMHPSTAPPFAPAEKIDPGAVFDVPRSDGGEVTHGVAGSLEGVQEEEDGEEAEVSEYVEGDLDGVEHLSGDASDDGSECHSDRGVDDRE